MVIALITGGFLSTQNGPNGPALVEFPATSNTVTAEVIALLVSVPGDTIVARLKLACDGSAKPERLSLATQGTPTSGACHPAAGTLQVSAGGVRSKLMVNVGSAVESCPAELVTTLSGVPEESVAAYVNTVDPCTAAAAGTRIDPVDPVKVPDTGAGRSSPVAL